MEPAIPLDCAVNGARLTKGIQRSSQNFGLVTYLQQRRDGVSCATEVLVSNRILTRQELQAFALR